MDFTYRERPVFTKGWQSRQGMLPSDYWHRNMFVEFMEDDIGIQLRAHHRRRTTCCGAMTSRMPSRPGRKSQEFLDRLFAGTSEEDRRKITSDNAAKLFRFHLS